MPNVKKGDILVDSIVAIETKSDMRDKLVENLRTQARQSRSQRAQRAKGRMVGIGLRDASVSPSITDAEPQSVLIKNRSQHLANEVLRLRTRYANLLTEKSGD